MRLYNQYQRIKAQNSIVPQISVDLLAGSAQPTTDEVSNKNI